MTRIVTHTGRTTCESTFETPAALADEAAAIWSPIARSDARSAETIAARIATRRVKLEAYFDRLEPVAARAIRRAMRGGRDARGFGRRRSPARSPIPDGRRMDEAFRAAARSASVSDRAAVERDVATRSAQAGDQPGQAFGTGHHPTTYGALRDRGTLRKRHFAHALDVGTGSGILAIAMRCWASRRSPRSISMRSHSRTRARMPTQSARRQIRFATSRCALRRHFDLIAANILSSTLIEMAPALSGCLRAGASDPRRYSRARGADGAPHYQPRLRCLACGATRMEHAGARAMKRAAALRDSSRRSRARSRGSAAPSCIICAT